MSPEQKKFYNAIPKSWQKALYEECKKNYIQDLVQFLKKEEYLGKTIYPEKQNIFAALRETNLDDVKVVVVGQDPYHGPNQAHGLSFSVQPGIVTPPSLKNIYKELKDDLNIHPKENGYLLSWAKQGVLLLNSVLTVEKGLPASHAKMGWEKFTDSILKAVMLQKKPAVFLLWGAYAQKKIDNLDNFIDNNIHLILKSGHPSPLSVKKFLSNKHFSQTNYFLLQQGLSKIDW